MQMCTSYSTEGLRQEFAQRGLDYDFVLSTLKRFGGLTRKARARFYEKHPFGSGTTYGEIAQWMDQQPRSAWTRTRRRDHELTV